MPRMTSESQSGPSASWLIPPGPGPVCPTLTVVRGAAGQELGGGAAAFLGQVNGHLYIFHPLVHLRPRTGGEMDVRFFPGHGEMGAGAGQIMGLGLARGRRGALPRVSTRGQCSPAHGAGPRVAVNPASRVCSRGFSQVCCFQPLDYFCPTGKTDRGLQRFRPQG